MKKLIVLNRQNYRGDTYQNRRKMQIESAKYWSDLFYPNPKEFDKARKHINGFVELILKENNSNSEHLKRKLE